MTEDRARPIISEEGEAWRVCQSNAGRALQASAAVFGLGFPTYVPMEAREVRRARKVEVRRRPLFGDYFFARFALDDDWQPIGSAMYARGLLCVGDRPASVPDELIDGLRAAEGEVIRLDAEVRMLKPGDLVRISRGLWQGHVGELQQLDELGRMVVLMNGFGRKVRVVGNAHELGATAEVSARVSVSL